MEIVDQFDLLETELAAIGISDIPPEAKIKQLSLVLQPVVNEIAQLDRRMAAIEQKLGKLDK